MDWSVVIPTSLSIVGVFTLLYVAQLRGWIYLKPQVDQIIKGYDERLKEARDDRDARVAEVRADRDARVAEIITDRAQRIAELAEERAYLRETLTVAERALEMQTEQMEEIVDVNKTSHVALQSIVRAAEEKRGGHGDG